MRISISNLAWDPAEDGAVISLLRKYGVTAIDVAPAKLFPDIAAAAASEIAALRELAPGRVVCIEMAGAADGGNLRRVDAALAFAMRHYGD
jgi:hypothetical protein